MALAELPAQADRLQQSVQYNGREFQVFGTAAARPLMRTCIESADIPHQYHDTYTASVALDDDPFRYNVRISDPIEPTNKTTVVQMLGLGENLARSSGRKHHDYLARELPGSRVITVANNLSRPDIHTMAEQRRELVAAICGEQPVIFTAASLSTRVLLEMLRLEEKDPALTIAGNVLYAPHIVPTDRVFEDTLVEFPLGSALGMLRHGPVNAGRVASHVAGMLLHPREWPAYTVQTLDILMGVLREDIKASLAGHAHHTVVTAGANDSGAQIDMWQELQEELPGLEVHVVPNKDHTMMVDSRKRAHKVAQLLARNGWLQASG